MTHDYMLIFGSNVYADPVYRLSYKPDQNNKDRVPLFTLENCDGDLVLKTEIRDENSNLIAKIDKNEFIQLTENLEAEGRIEAGSGFTLTRKKDKTVIYNVRITEDRYVVVTGTFYVEDKKIRITDSSVEINDVSRKSINGVDMHDAIFVGTCDITLTNDGMII
jgi:hypothetical protein